MKNLILVLLLSLMQNSAYAAPSSAIAWADLELDRTVKLSKPLSVDANHVFPKGTTFRIEEEDSLAPAEVALFTLVQTNCGPNANHTPISMVVLDERYGFEWNDKCEASFYVETKDLYATSYFEKASR